MFDDRNIAISYWKMVVEEYLENLMDDTLEINDKLINELASNLIGDDDLWLEIDNAISYYLQQKRLSN